MKLLFTSLLTALALIVGTPVRAELMGIIPGRGANLYSQPVFSLEAGSSWYTDQLKWSAVRINVKPIHGALAYIDYALLRASNLPTNSSRRANFSGIGFGGGLIFIVPDFFTTYDVAFKTAYHTSVIDEVGTQTMINSDLDVSALKPSQWSAEFVASPIDPLYENGLTWYATLGYVSTKAHAKMRASGLGTAKSINYEQKDGVSFGLGLIQPLGRGQYFAGFEWLSGDPLIGVGFRYAIK